jgi:hypothetical protein
VKISMIVAMASLIFYQSSFAQSRNKVDLEDLTIKGELQNDDRLNMIGREKNELRNRVKFRTSYRPEMIEALPTPAPGGFDP